MARHVQPAGRQQGAVEESATRGGVASAMAGDSGRGHFNCVANASVQPKVET